MILSKLFLVSVTKKLDHLSFQYSFIFKGIVEEHIEVSVNNF